jgi:hypothetical protein
MECPKPITPSACEKIVRYAFEYVRRHSREKVPSPPDAASPSPTERRAPRTWPARSLRQRLRHHEFVPWRIGPVL